VPDPDEPDLATLVDRERYVAAIGSSAPEADVTTRLKRRRSCIDRKVKFAFLVSTTVPTQEKHNVAHYCVGHTVVIHRWIANRKRFTAEGEF
jgi:hypothetical protein